MGDADNGEDGWDAHWSSFGFRVAANPANQYRGQLIRRILNSGGPVDRIIDLGCGQGELSLQLKRWFPQAQVRGLDYSEVGIAHARRAAARANLAVEFEVTDLLSPPINGENRELGWATHGVCSEVLEHVDEPAVLLRNARAYMDVGAQLVVTVPGGPRSAFDRHIGHRRHFTKASLRAVLSEGGFDPVTVVASGFPFFNIYRLAVIARGKRLVGDVSTATEDPAPSRALMTAFALFRVAFALNLPSAPWGWQMVGTAHQMRDPYSVE